MVAYVQVRIPGRSIGKGVKPETHMLTCGCLYYVGREAIHEMCPACYAGWRAIHAQAMIDYRKTHPLDDIEL